MKKLILILFVINAFTNIYAEDFIFDWELENEQKVGSYDSFSLYMFNQSVTLPHMATNSSWPYEYIYIDGTYLGACRTTPSNSKPIGHTLDLSPYTDGKIHHLRIYFTHRYAERTEFICYFMAKPDPINMISYWFDNTTNTASVCGIDKDEAIINIPETVELNGTIFDVTSIGQFAMYENENLKNVTLPTSIKSIGEYAFYGCVNLEEIIIPEGTTLIQSSAFRNTTSLKSLYLQRGDAVLALEETPFYGSGIEYLFLGRDLNGVLGVGKTLQRIQVGSNVNYIGDDAFNGCSNLESVSFIAGNLTKIGKRAFKGCTMLPSINLPNTVETVMDGAFQQCKALETVNLSNRLTKIASETFSGCSALNSITLPSGITSIENSAFSTCRSLTAINLPEWITRIGNSAFYGCTLLDNVSLPSRLVTIGDWAYAYCSNLTSISIPNSVTSVGVKAFYYCTSLVEANLSENITAIPDYLFYFCDELEGITIPEKVTSIGNFAFRGCESLIYATLPVKLTSIGHYAFEEARALTEITIPANVTNIGAGAFDGCDNLITVNSLNSLPPTCADANAFSQSTYKNAVLWVPAPSVEDYMTFVGWKEFKNYDALEAISSIKLTGPSNVLRINKTMDLEATVVPSNISVGNLKWSSSNPIVATVDNNGTVTALSPGYVVITAKSQDIIATEGTYELTVMDYLLGDSNESDDVTITDAVNIASYVMGENPAVFNFYASDVNQSNDITLADASGVISIILDSTYAALANSARRIRTVDNEVLRADDFSIYFGETVNVPVSLESDKDYVALQADITTSNGLKISDVVSSACLDDTHMFIQKRISDDAVRIIIYSPALNEIPYNDNSLFDVVVSGNPAEGASLNITNILATDTGLEEHQIGFEGGKCEALTTGIVDVSGSVSVKTEPGVIIVGGAEGCDVKIYSINGMEILSTRVADNEERYSLAPGAYIVTIGSHVEKVILR